MKRHSLLLACLPLCLLAPEAAWGSEWPAMVPVVISPWWQIADEDFDAGRFGNRPVPGEPTLKEQQQCSDFTIYRAANDKWQLVSAVRNTRFPSGGHLLFHWEADRLSDRNWKERGIFWTTHESLPEAGYTEGVVYAPHTVEDDGRFYMFHNSGGTAHVFTSDDGVHFTQGRSHDGSFVLFDTGEAGRDLMVLDNRDRDSLWYVYYTSVDRSRPQIEGRQHTDVYRRTAKRLLGPWSEPAPVGMGTSPRPRHIIHAPYDFVTAESPFVIFHEGFYYKFEQALVVASRDPSDFEGKPVVAGIFPHFSYPEEWWPALAPEIIRDGDKLYIAYFMNHHRHPLQSLEQGGVFLAELGWKSATGR